MPVRRILVVVGGVAGGLLIVSAVMILAGQILAKRSLRSDVDELYSGATINEGDIVSESDLDGLPEPVQRWLRSSNVIGKKPVQTVRLMQSGEFRQSQDGRWMPFEAEEYYTTDPPEFLWKASFKVTAIPFMEVRDSYRDGRGKTSVRLASLIPVGTETGPEMDQGDLLRFLNEIMWFPSAALSDYIDWSPVDASSARATMSHGGVTGSAVFHFDEAGRLINMIADRYGKFGDTYSVEQWSTPLSEHEQFHGIQVPTRGVGIWNLESGDFAYIRLEVTDIDYNVGEAY